MAWVHYENASKNYLAQIQTDDVRVANVHLPQNLDMMDSNYRKIVKTDRKNKNEKFNSCLTTFTEHLIFTKQSINHDQCASLILNACEFYAQIYALFKNASDEML